jgi:hypothetical protein
MFAIIMQLAMGAVVGAVCQLADINIFITGILSLLAAFWIGRDCDKMDPVKKETDAMLTSVRSKLSGR